MQRNPAVEQSPNLALPYIMPAQAQKHVTHNEAVRMLDALVQLAVLDRDRATPPDTPREGDRHIVATGATGDWSGKEGAVAAWQDGAWGFFTPRAGWLVWVAGEVRLVAFDGADWVAAGTDASGAATFGINASADDINRLAVAAPATLRKHEGADHQLKINKLAPGDTASLLFQTDFSGRAEMGTAGNDDFRFKVSPDGAQWFEAIAIDRATGTVSLPRTPLRAQLTAPRTYYVRADGDDGNDGLADTTGRAFATIQKAIDTAATLDLSVHDVTIRVGPGTYAAFAMKSCVGAGQVVIVGDEDVPANVAVASTASSLPLAWALNVTTVYRLRGLSFRAAHNGVVAIQSEGTSYVFFRNCAFGQMAAAAGSSHLGAQFGGTVEAEGNWTITGGAVQHIRGLVGGYLRLNNRTVTLTGTPAFQQFARASRTAEIIAQGMSFASAATGRRFWADLNGVVNGPTSLTYFPGDAPGIAATGGRYGNLGVVFDHGVRAGGTLTPTPADGDVQKIVNGGAHTLAPPAAPCEIVLRYLNNASAGPVTTAGYDVVQGGFDTTDGHRFEAHISHDGETSILRVVAL